MESVLPDAIAIDALRTPRMVVPAPDGVPASVRPEANEIYADCHRHPALAALDRFNAHFESRHLTRTELRIFLASLAAFNRHTIGGIAILAGRLSDDLLPLLPITGHEIGAYILDAAVDEYGLRDSVTHVELARNFATYLGIGPEEVDSAAHACRSAIDLGDALFGWYREPPTGFALGVHLASEITSVKEFASWHDIFLKFPGYALSRDTPEFEYMRAHYVHEPEHIHGARICVSRYLDVLPAQGQLLREGAYAYLNAYRTMFHELDTLIFK